MVAFATPAVQPQLHTPNMKPSHLCHSTTPFSINHQPIINQSSINHASKEGRIHTPDIESAAYGETCGIGHKARDAYQEPADANLSSLPLASLPSLSLSHTLRQGLEVDTMRPFVKLRTADFTASQHCGKPPPLGL